MQLTEDQLVLIRIGTKMRRRKQTERASYKDIPGNQERKHRPWTPEEKRLILEPSHPSDRVLSEMLKRPVEAIQQERSRLRKQ